MSTNSYADEKPEPKIKEIKQAVAKLDKKTAAEKAAKELANPNTVYATMTFKFQYSSGYEGNGSSLATVFQPSMPMPLANGDKVFFRPAITYIDNDYSFGDDVNVDSHGFSDISFDLMYSPTLSDPTNLVGLGVLTTLPTGSAGISGNQYAMGPEFFVGKLSGKRVFGALTSHQWGFNADKGVEQTNRTAMQLMWVEIAGGGWTYGSAPQLSYDWNNDQAEIPLNLMLSKTVIMGQRPWKLGMEVNYYVEKAQHRPDFMFSFSIAPVVENRLATLLQ
ncbi:possible neuromedin U precursor [Vibrio sp. JCM 19236]|nr:possible neuromedin U precursor [Vibrio sp. JCM 19236]